MKRIFTILLVVLAGCSTQPPPRQTSAFRLEADHLFYSQIKRSWILKVENSGAGKFQMLGGTEQDIALQEGAIAKLKDALRAYDVFTLKDSYGSIPVDGPERRIHVEMNGRKKHITIYTLRPEDCASANNRREVSRLLNIWIVIRSTFNDPVALDSRGNDRAILEQMH